MIHIKRYKKFNESLVDDFNNHLNNTPKNLKKSSEEFLGAIKDDKYKSEFMYRVSDGEDIIDLIEEFVDKCNLDDESQFRFRSLVFSNRLKELSIKYDEGDRKAGLDLVQLAERDGVDLTTKYLIGYIEKIPQVTVDRVIDLIQVALGWLEENEKLINWTYQRNQNTNLKKIESGKYLIKALKEIS